MTHPANEWMDEGACRGKPQEWWYPELPEDGGQVSYKKAAAYCAVCPVREQCDDYANNALSFMEAQVGMWAGRSPKERMKVRRTIRATVYGVRNCDVCGTEFDAHTPTARYCDDTCRDTGHRLRHRDLMRLRRAS